MDDERTRSTAVEPPRSSDDEARAFLQERLAYLGKVYASIGIGFYLVGNLADFAGGPGFLSRRWTDMYTWVVPSACAMYVAQWAVCRRAPLGTPILRSIDAATTTLTAAFNSLIRSVHAARKNRRGRNGCRVPREPRHAAPSDTVKLKVVIADQGRPRKIGVGCPS